GGDFAPREALAGVKQFLESNPDNSEIVLIGDEAQAKPLLTSLGIDPNKISTVHAPECIGMQEHPTKALKGKPHSSINVGFQLLAREDIHAFISAGNSGAMMVGALYSLKVIEGIQRPTISTMLPHLDGSYGLLLDVGINSDCKPEN